MNSSNLFPVAFRSILKHFLWIHWGNIESMLWVQTAKSKKQNRWKDFVKSFSKQILIKHVINEEFFNSWWLIHFPLIHLQKSAVIVFFFVARCASLFPWRLTQTWEPSLVHGCFTHQHFKWERREKEGVYWLLVYSLNVCIYFGGDILHTCAATRLKEFKYESKQVVCWNP